MRFIIFILVVFRSVGVFAQAELDKVRDMFPEPNEHLDVEIWKGHMDSAHPVEFFFAIDEGFLQGYYRIISSGDEFLLEGDVHSGSAFISEFSQTGESLGVFEVIDFKEHRDESKMQWKWYNNNRTDIIEFDLGAVHFSDYPPELFYPSVKKFVKYDDRGVESIMVEHISLDESIITRSSLHTDQTNRVKMNSTESVDFEIDEDTVQLIFNEVNGSLRKRAGNSLEFYSLDKELQIKPMTYASRFFLYNVEYAQSGHKGFDQWIKGAIDRRKQEAKNKISRKISQDEPEDARNHFRFRWSSWTEIDYLSSDAIAGRMIFIQSWDNKIETISFQYDFTKGEPFDIIGEFKPDFNMNDYLRNYIKTELNQYSSSQKGKSYNLEIEDFTELSFSDHYLIVGTKFHWEYGYHTFRIPFSDLAGLLKRNSILKPIMKS